MGQSDKARVLIVLTLIAGMVGVAGYWVESEPTDTDRYYLRNSGGAVLFEHQAHVDLADGCESCHHDLLLSDSRQACSECHGEDVVADDFSHDDLKMIEAHTCGFCHRIDESAQAQSCRHCHAPVQEAALRIVTCTECHDDDYTKDLLTHDEMQEVDGHSCEGCHNPRAINVVYHQQCTRCHLIENHKLFTAKDGGVRCEMCHLK
jgi:hypothetical protein